MRLAPYAMRDELTEGRRYPEEPHPYRSEYQRDRDRIVHTKAFRRLENKTQVFDPDYSDHFRNRLTHTIEVSQITRTISEALGLNTDLCEVLALSHDIGHPPFSHEGERVLDQLMRNHGSGFDHNLHSLRIVEDFEEKYISFRGLNLTFEVREGIVKHSRDCTEGQEYHVDISEYRLGERPPLEAQVIDLADEIAYNTADLDDGYDSGLLTVEQMVEQMELFQSLYRQVEAKYPEAAEKLRVSETVRRVIDVLVTNLLYQTRRVLENHGIRSVEEVRLIPAREQLPNLVGQAKIEQFLSVINFDRCSNETRERMEDELANLVSDSNAETLSFYNGLINQDGLLEYMPQHGLVVMERASRIEAEALELEERFGRMRSSREDRGELPAHFPSPYMDWQEFYEELERALGRSLEQPSPRALELLTSDLNLNHNHNLNLEPQPQSGSQSESAPVDRPNNGRTGSSRGATLSLQTREESTQEKVLRMGGLLAEKLSMPTADLEPKSSDPLVEEEQTDL